MNFGDQPFDGRYEHAVEADNYDVADWEEVLVDITALKREQERMFQDWDYMPNTFQDTFMELYQPDPRVRDEWTVKEKYLFNRAVVDEFSKLEEVQKLRIDCFNDLYSSAFAMTGLVPALEDIFLKNKELHDQLQEMAEQIAQQQQQPGGMDPQAQADAQGQMQQMIQDAGLGDQIKKAMGKAADKASRDLGDQQEAARSFGLEQGQLERMPFPERQALMQKLTNKEMQKFADLLGTFRLVARAAKRDVKSDTPEEMHSLVLGQDVERASFSSLMNLADDLTEDLFWNALLSGELVQNKLVGPATLGRGPVMMVVDESGSMSSPCAGVTRMKWAKALALVLLEQCRKYGRDFTYIGFSGYHQSWSWQAEKGRCAPASITQLIEHFFNGGTSPYESLVDAMNIIGRYPATNRPDLIMVSDGEFAVPDAGFLKNWNDMKTRTKAQTFGVALQDGGRSMQPLMDSVLKLTDLTARAGSMGDIIKKINN
jgi:uncharacterized protein with von Willebrand factor type A (vWA) domain